MPLRSSQKAAQILDGAVSLTLSILKQSPEPISSSVGNILSEIYTVVEATKQNQNQLRFLLMRTCIILQSLSTKQNYNDEELQHQVRNLISVLESVRDFAVAQQKKSLLSLLFTPDDLRLQIDEHERAILSACAAFQNAGILRANQKLDDMGDQGNAHYQDLVDRLEEMKTATMNPKFLDEVLGAMHADANKTMIAMQAVLERERTGRDTLTDETRSFLEAGLARLKGETGADVHTDWWTVTEYEIEKSFKIGSSSSLGRWQGLPVVIQNVKSAETLSAAVKLWERLHHPNILSFLAASTLDDSPFVIWPYMVNGTARNHIIEHPDVDLLSIAYETLQALQYLHARKPPVVHGNLRPPCLLMNEAGHVVVAGVGLDPSETDIAHLSAPEQWTIRLLRMRWRAPEIMLDPHPSPTPASDIYSWALIVVHLFGNALPPEIGEIADGARPARPDFGRVPALAPRGIQDAFWALIQRCWASTASERPSAADVSAEIVHLVPWMDPTKALFELPRPLLQATNQENMRLRSSTRYDYIMVTEHNPRSPYISTKPLTGRGEHPVRLVNFVLRCHDQGYHDDPSEWRGRWAWLEAALIRASGEEVNFAREAPNFERGHMIEETRVELVRPRFADKQQQIYSVKWGEDHALVKLMRKGDRVVVIPRALFPGWETHVYGVEIHVVSEH
ncbi:kinase-like protein [Auriscalpium vulgare]|uniref:Kinase-like protein n=1 Tax=Auriscalpium vulgare TaxID=40419 RepID=A0ACB8RG33_9AGAM|nr:kinase-like protein [Auriscalpium vulgare]